LIRIRALAIARNGCGSGDCALTEGPKASRIKLLGLKTIES
jgi:hypothetical protein